MKKTCQKCGISLQENDFLCPKCGAIYGEPIDEAPHTEKTATPAAPKRTSKTFGIFVLIVLMIPLLCLLIWNPFQPAATTPGTSHTQSTTTAAPTPPPTTLPPTIPTTVPPTTLPFNQKKLNWIMDAKVVDTSGKLISNTTVTLNGIITKNLEASDTILLEIVFPMSSPYIIQPKGSVEYFDFSNGIFGAYYICKASAFDCSTNSPAWINFAIDAEAECALFILPDHPEQYLVCSTDADVNAVEVMARFQAFLDSRNPN